MRGDNVKLHRLQVTIDLHKSKLYVKTKQKFSKDFNSFASKVDKRKIVQVNGEWKLYKENKEISTLTLKEAMLLFLSFCSRVSGKIWKIEPSPEQPLKNVFTGGAPRSLHFSYIGFD